MDLSFPLCVLSLLLVGYSYAQELIIEPKDDRLTKKIGDGFTLICKTQGVPADEDPKLRWLDPRDEPIGLYSSDKSSIRNRIYVLDVAGQKLLQFESVEGDQDAGKYTCVGTINGAEVSKDITIDLSVDITVTSNPNQSPIVNTSALIECKTTFAQPPKVVWLNAARQPINMVGRYKQDPYGLIIKDITQADNGIYVCLVTSENPIKTKFFEINVTVTVPPRMKGPPNPSDPIVGREFTMTCSADGTPKPDFEFRKGTMILDKGRYSVEVRKNPKIDQSEGILKIAILEDRDEGEYSCIARNNGGNVTETLFVNTIVPPTIKPIVNKTATEGKKTSLVCEVRSDPDANVLWKITGTDTVISTDKEKNIKIDEEIERGDRIVVVKSILKFNLLKSSDTNNYTCFASNKAGSDEKYGRVIVEFKPNFDNTPYSATHGWVNHKTEIKCVVDSEPFPSITWLKGAETIADGGYYKISQAKGVRQLTSTLTVTVNIENQDTIFGTFTCKAQNMIGTATHDIVLKKASVPIAPTARVTDSTSTTLVIMINPPKDNGGQAVIDYKVIYFKKDNEKNSTTRMADSSKDPNEARSRFMIDNLEPKTTYVIDVEARNNVGYGKQFRLVADTEAVSEPGTPEITSSEQSTSANEYLLTWKLTRTGGAPMRHFVIDYVRVELNADKSLNRVFGDSKIVQASKDATSHMLKGLMPESDYQIYLKAINTVGGSKAATIFIRTPKGQMPVTGGSVSVHVSLLSSALLLLPAAAAVKASGW